MNSHNEVEKLEIALIQMMESQVLSDDDYNMLTKYLGKIKADLNHKEQLLESSKNHPLTTRKSG